MAINISFGGANIQRPGAFSVTDSSAMTPVNTGSFKVLAVVGVPNVSNNVYARAQAVQNTVVGTVSTAGNATVTVQAVGLAGSPVTVSVAVALSDTASMVVTKIVTALQGNTAVNGFFTIAGAGATLTLTAKTITANDPTMKVTVSNGTAVGLTTTASAITTTGVVGGVAYFNDATVAKQALGVCDALDLMNIAWTHGADLIAFAPVAQAGADADWQTAIDLLKKEYVDGVLVASTASTINAKIQAHCALMSSVLNRRERRAFVGHASGLSISAITALQVFNDELVTMASPGVYYYDVNGNKVLKGSHYLASAYAGLWAGMASQSPITYDYVKFPGIETVYEGTELITLLNAGIAPVELTKKGYRIVQGLTTSNSSDLSLCELSVSTTKIEMNQAIRNFMEDTHIGQAGQAGIEVTIYNDLITLIEGFITAGLITGYDKTSVSVVKNGTSFVLNWLGYPTLPINNFLVTSHINLG